MTLIFCWQLNFWIAPGKLDKSWRDDATTGMADDYKAFYYFFSNAGLFPVVYNGRCHDYSEQGAKLLIEKQGGKLRTESGMTARYGELGKIFLWYPSIWLSPLCPSTIPANAIFFIISLMGLFFSCWLINQPFLGAALALALGGHPFQLHETYGNDNVFSWAQTTMIAMLALHLPFIASPIRGKSKWFWLSLPLAVGLILGTVRQIRTEPCLVMGAVLIIYLTARRTAFALKIGLVATMLLSFIIVDRCWKNYFKYKISEAEAVVGASGGIPYSGPKDTGHHLWHSIWCGMGDFDNTHGYKWNDTAAYLYAMPRLIAFHNLVLPEEARFDEFTFENLEWRNGAISLVEDGENPVYFVEPSQFDHYNEIVRDKILIDITENPLWFAKIIMRRIWRITTEYAPIRMGWNGHWLNIPFPGWMALIAAVILLLQKAWFPLKVFLFSTTLSITPLMVYSGGGICYYSCYTHTMFAIFCALIMELIFRTKPWRKKSASNLNGKIS